MKTVKIGDSVRCILNHELSDITKAEAPKKGVLYKVSFVDGNYIGLEGMDQSFVWHVRFFSKEENTITSLLANLLLSSQIERESEYERLFCLNAKF